MTNITIDVIIANISDDYQPTDTELLILQDIVRDLKASVIKGEYPITYKAAQLNRAKHKETDSVSIMELFDYKVKIDPERLSLLSDKKRLLIKNNKSNKYYKQRF